ASLPCAEALLRGRQLPYHDRPGATQDRSQGAIQPQIARDMARIFCIFAAMPRRAFRIGRSTTGLGVFAVKPIKRRTHIVAYRGPLLTEEEAERREAQDS